jgi:hypothetical protein
LAMLLLIWATSWRRMSANSRAWARSQERVIASTSAIAFAPCDRSPAL